MSDQGLLDGLLRCQMHQCPMLLVDRHYVCLLEYTDQRLGQRQVCDVVPGKSQRHKGRPSPASLVFDNGLTWPLICACCGGLMHITQPDVFLNRIQGLYLVGLTYCPADKDEPESLNLFFSPDPEGKLQEEASLAVHLESVRQIA